MFSDHAVYVCIPGSFSEICDSDWPSEPLSFSEFEVISGTFQDDVLLFGVLNTSPSDSDNLQMYMELDITDYFVLVVECFIWVIKITCYIFAKSFYSGIYYIYLLV